MGQYSTNQAAKKLGLSIMSLHRYMKAKKIPVPKLQQVGGVKVRFWGDDDIENVRKLLPKIANGRKTRYQKLREAEARRKAKKKQSKRK